MEINTIYNEDCFVTMRNMIDDDLKVDIVLTSPPYCTKSDDAKRYNEKTFNNYQIRYDVFEGFESPEAYREWTINLFNQYDKVLNTDGVVLYNISYSANNPDLMWLCIADVINNTNFTVADCIVWKKNSALPQNQNKNRATRICEFIFVFCRKSELLTFNSNKIKSGVKYGNLFTNYIEAPNNDIMSTDINKLNGATFSSKMVIQLLNNYAKVGNLVYDSFMGTGTTAVACKQYGCNYIGSELSGNQCEFAKQRLNGIDRLKKSNVRKLI